MHSVRFHMRSRSTLSDAALNARFEDDPFVATTRKFDSNRIFELGRRYGVQGRIFAHAIVVANNLLVHGNDIRGWAFVPQEGNTLVSSLEAMLRFRGASDSSLRAVRQRLIERHW